MSLRRKLGSLLSDALTYGGSSVAGQLLGLLLLPLYTRYLSPSDYGTVAMLSLLVAAFVPVANLGMTNAVFRRFNLEKDPAARRRVLRSGLLSVTLSASLLSLLVALGARPLAGWLLDAPARADLVLVAVAGGFASAVGAVPLAVTRAYRRVRVAALTSVAKVVVSAGMTILLVVVLEQGVAGVLLGMLAGEGFSAVCLFAATRHDYSGAFDGATWKRMFSYGAPFVPHQVQALALVGFGQFVVRELIGLSEAGKYEVALKFAVPVAFVVNAAQRAWVPFKFQIHADDADPAGFFRSATTYYVATTTYIWLGVSLWGPELLELLTPVDFHVGAGLVAALAGVHLARGFYFMAGTGFEMSAKTGPAPLISLAGLVVVVALSFSLTAPLGAIGAALANTAGWLAMAVVIYRLAQKRFVVKYDWLVLSWLLCSGLTLYVLGSSVRSLEVGPRVVVLAVLSLCYPVLALLGLARSSTERARVVAVLSRITGSRAGQG